MGPRGLALAADSGRPRRKGASQAISPTLTPTASFNPQPGPQVHAINTHTGIAGDCIVSASDSTLRLWDRLTGELLLTIPGQVPGHIPKPVEATAVDFDLYTVVSGSWDGTAR